MGHQGRRFRRQATDLHLAGISLQGPAMEPPRPESRRGQVTGPWSFENRDLQAHFRRHDIARICHLGGRLVSQQRSAAISLGSGFWSWIRRVGFRNIRKCCAATLTLSASCAMCTFARDQRAPEQMAAGVRRSSSINSSWTRASTSPVIKPFSSNGLSRWVPATRSLRRHLRHRLLWLMSRRRALTAFGLRTSLESSRTAPAA
mmetsp:Transcript_56367/g.183097  ORF Transcript_56367/g.183097 Transcript_56367/m.183097 type:complete len:203 (-) Transcript_56367:146-754(-)